MPSPQGIAPEIAVELKRSVRRPPTTGDKTTGGPTKPAIDGPNERTKAPAIPGPARRPLTPVPGGPLRETGLLVPAVTVRPRPRPTRNSGLDINDASVGRRNTGHTLDIASSVSETSFTSQTLNTGYFLMQIRMFYDRTHGRYTGSGYSWGKGHHKTLSLKGGTTTHTERNSVLTAAQTKTPSTNGYRGQGNRPIYKIPRRSKSASRRYRSWQRSLG